MPTEHPDGGSETPLPKLVREVELPRPRSGGAAAVLVATMAMFTAIGASAFVVRARATRGRACSHSRRPPEAVAPLAPRLESHDNALTEQFWDARNRGDQETALDLYLHLSVERRLLLAPTRDELARAYQEEQLAEIDDAVDELRCEDADHRLRRLRRLVPEATLPVAMDACITR